MIGHHHVFIQFNFCPNCPRPLPFIGNDPTEIVQHHLAVNHPPEQRLPVSGDNGHKIRPFGGVIVTLQTDVLAPGIGHLEISYLFL